jgi:hypothetical protein
MSIENKTEQIDTQNLADKTICISLDFNSFGNSKKAHVEVKTDANQERFTHSKRLLNSPELKAIKKADVALKMWLDTPTRCWSFTRSMRFVPLDLVEEVYEVCSKYQSLTRPKLVKDFVAAYLEQVAEAQKELGSEFNSHDYPTVEQVEQEFSFDFKFLSFSTPDKLKAISPALYLAEKEKAHKSLMSAASEVRDGMRLVFQEMVDHLVTILTPDSDGKKKRLHTSTVGKLQDFLNTFELRNVTNDDELQGEVSKLKALMAGVNTEQIKESDNLQADIIAKFSEVSKNMHELVQVSGRKFR